MKVKSYVTEIEASAEELRQSNILADAFSNILRNAINPMIYVDDDDEEETEDEKAD